MDYFTFVAMGVRKFCFLLYYSIFVQLISGVPIDEVSRNYLFPSTQPNLITSSNKLTSSSEKSFKSSNSNLGAVNSIVSSGNLGSTTKSLNEKLSQSLQKLKQELSLSQSSGLFSNQNSNLNGGSESFKSVKSILDPNDNPVSVVSSKSISNAGRTSPNLSIESASQAIAGSTISRGSLPVSKSSATVSQVSSTAVADKNASTSDLPQSFVNSRFKSAFPSFAHSLSQSNTKRESGIEPTSSFLRFSNRHAVSGVPSLKLEGIPNTYTREDSSASAASNLNGLSASSNSESSSVSDNNAVSGANVLNSNSFNIRPFNPFAQYSNPIGSSVENDAIAQTVTESSTSVSNANNIGNSHSLGGNNFAGFPSSLGQSYAKGISSDKEVFSSANNLQTNTRNFISNNIVSSDSVSSLGQQSSFTGGVPQFFIPLTNGQTPTSSAATNYNSNQGFNALTNSASPSLNHVSSPNFPFATNFFNQGFNAQILSQQNSVSDTQSTSLPSALSLSAIGSQTQSFSLSPQVSSQNGYSINSVNPVNSISFASNFPLLSNSISNTARPEINEISGQTVSNNVSPNSQAFSQNIIANSQQAPIVSFSQGFPSIGGDGQTLSLGAFQKNIDSHPNSPSQITTPSPSNVQPQTSFISNGLSQSTTTESPFAFNNRAVNKQASFNIVPNSLNLQPLSSINGFAGALTNAIQPALSAAENQITQSINNNAVTTEQVTSVSSTTASQDNGVSFAQNPFGVGISQFHTGPQNLPISKFTNPPSSSFTHPLTSSFSNPSVSTNPGLPSDQRFISLSSAGLTTPFSNNQPGSSLVTDNSMNNVAAVTSSGNPFGASSVNSNVAESSAFTSSLANGLSINSQSPLVTNSQVIQSSTSTVSTPQSAYPSNSFGFAPFNYNPYSTPLIYSLGNAFSNNIQPPINISNPVIEKSATNTINSFGSGFSNNIQSPIDTSNTVIEKSVTNSINSIGKGLSNNIQSAIDTSNTVIEKSVNTVSITPAQNQFTFIPFNSNTRESSVSFNSYNGVTNNANSADTLLSTIGSSPNVLGSLPPSNAFASSSITKVQESVSNPSLYKTPIYSQPNQSPNLPNLQLYNYPPNNPILQNTGYTEQIVQNLQPIPEITVPYNQQSTLTPQTAESNYLSQTSNFVSSNSISAPSYPTDLSHTLPVVASDNKGSVALSESVSSQQLGLNSANSLSSALASSPPSLKSNLLSSPSSIVISPGFTQTSLPNPVLSAPGYLPPIFVGNSRSNDCVDDFVELIVLSELINGIDGNCNCINNPWLAYLLTCL